MKKLTLYISALLLIVVSFTSCKKWLDVKPENVFTEDQIFENPQSVYKALNGIYLSMSKTNLYGASLTMFFTDVMAQYYNVNPNHVYKNYAGYAFDQDNVKATGENIWGNMYVCITNANSFVAQLDKYKGVVTPSQDSILRGEAIAIRAFLHFDLLRLYGPIYSSADSTLPSIPYYRRTSSTYNPYLPANIVMDSVLDDLKVAESLLSNDPVITFGVSGNTDPNTDPFFQSRNLRMNYYAVKALEARAYLYRGNKSAANDAAQFVITRAQQYFPWVTSSQLTTDAANADRAFSTELIFAVQSLDLYSNSTRYFAPTLFDDHILAPIDTRLAAMMESNTYPDDFRNTSWWIMSTVGGKSYKTFNKFADVADSRMTFRYRMPMIRMSEMYYIAAETAPDNNTAITLLDTVRFHRNVGLLPANAAPAVEIKKEYQKEFYGEGQLFFYYKRTNTKAVENGALASGTITMNKAQYVVPLPQSETNYH